MTSRPATPWIIALFSGLLIHACPAALRLTTDGQSDYQIVVPKDAIPSEKHAAKELQSFLKQIAGAELPIMDDSAPLPERAILLGRNAHLPATRTEVPWSKLGGEGFTLRTTGQHLIIAGGRPRGTLYGVYAFLEEHLGCRWFTSKVSRIPHQPCIRLDDINDTQVPVLEYREPFWFDSFDADWAARNRSNSASARLDETRGGKILYTGFVHTFQELVPPEKYYDQHPEYFSLVNGRRMKGYYQLCLTNPDVLRIVIEGVRQRLRQNPNTAIISVSQNDTHGYCECEPCKKIEAEEGGVHAGPIIRFVNAVAEAIEKEFPNVAVDTLAYQYSRAPVTKTRPRPNVIVRLCSIECCFSHPLVDEDTSFKNDIIGWSKMCDRVYIWDYVATFSHYILPFSNIETLQPNVQFFVKHGVKGIFEEGAYQSNGGEMAELKAYLLAKILWNPDTFVEQHRAEFMEGYYGKAAGTLDRYLRMLRDYAIANKVHEPIWINPDSGHCPPEVVAKANALFDEAERLTADDPDVLHRVRVARLPIQYVELSRQKLDTTRPWSIRGDRFGPEPDPAKVRLFEQFFAVCAKENVTHLNEGAVHPNTLREQVTPWIWGADLVTLENAAVRLRIAPLIGGRIVSIEDKARNRNVASLPGVLTPGFPYRGGYAESAGVSGRSPGAGQAFTIEGKPTRTEATLSTKLPDGQVLKRIIKLAPEGASWTIESTLSNAADQPRVARLHLRLELALGGENIIFKADGKETSLAIPADATTRRIVLSGDSLPKDGYTLTGPSGAGIQCRTKGNACQIVLENRCDGPVVSIDVLTPAKSLPPKQALSITTDYSLVNVPEQPAARVNHPAGLIEIQDDVFGLYREGTLSGLQDDATASNGVAAFIVGETNEWAISWTIDSRRFEPNAVYELSADIRFDLKGKTGGAAAFGVYDHEKKLCPCGGSISAADAKGTWQTIVLGRLAPRACQNVWFAPTNNPQNIARLYVDRIVFRKVQP